MKIAIMQPYLFPYIGYFQLLSSVDKFIIHDDVQWIKGGWINRNRILFEAKPEMLTLAVKKRSNYDNINEYEIVADPKNRTKFINKIRASYFNSEYFSEAYPIIKKIVLSEELNIVEYIKNSLEEISIYLNIKTPIRLSSKLVKNNESKGEDRVIEICKSVKAKTYINPIGGLALYDKSRFIENDIKLFFIKTGNIEYKQFDNVYIPNLSIIDVMMFNSPEKISSFLSNFNLI
jgi:hypothetical protein